MKSWQHRKLQWKLKRAQKLFDLDKIFTCLAAFAEPMSISEIAKRADLDPQRVNKLVRAEYKCGNLTSFPHMHDCPKGSNWPLYRVTEHGIKSQAKRFQALYPPQQHKPTFK